jgi:hypothetical protein
VELRWLRLAAELTGPICLEIETAELQELSMQRTQLINALQGPHWLG